MDTLVAINLRVLPFGMDQVDLMLDFISVGESAPPFFLGRRVDNKMGAHSKKSKKDLGPLLPITYIETMWRRRHMYDGLPYRNLAVKGVSPALPPKKTSGGNFSKGNQTLEVPNKNLAKSRSRDVGCPLYSHSPYSKR